MTKRERYNLGVWVMHYNLLVDYKKKHGNIDIDQNYEVDGVKLGLWLKRQRSDYRNGRLSERKFELLCKLDKEWYKLRNKQLSWEEHYELLVEYKKEHGNIDVPYNYVVNGVKLGNWLVNQRQAYRSKGKRHITQTQIILLNRLDPNWATKKVSYTDTSIYMDILKKYYEEHGNIDMTYDTVIDEINVGSWLRDQCHDYNLAGDNPPKAKLFIELDKMNNNWCRRLTARLNKKITDMKIYNEDLIDRTKKVLRDLKWENINEINSREDQEKIEKEMIKRIWR